MIRLRAVCNCVIEVGDLRITPDSDVLFALLLYLTSNRGRFVPRAELVELLWPDCDARTARHRLRQSIYQLKKCGACIEVPNADVTLQEGDVDLDYAHPADRRRQFVEASLPVTRLDFLPNYAPDFSVRFAQWVESERDKVRTILRADLQAVVADKRKRGEHADVIRLARACLDLDPLNREATFALAEAHAMLGHAGEAVAVLDQYRSELGAGQIESFRATGELRRRVMEVARTSVGEASGAPALVGRSEILEQLGSWANARDAGRARVIALSGEAGIGKTRLLSEGIRLAALGGARCIAYRPNANGHERPLAGVFDLLPRLLALPGAVGCSPEAFSRLSDLARGVHRDATLPEDRTDSAFRFATLRRSVLDLVEAVSAESTVVISLDDAHSLDRQSLEILLDAARGMGSRLALLLALRPLGDIASFIDAQADISRIRIPQLDPPSARAIVTRHLAADVVAERADLIDWAVDLSNGNPFFLVELSAHCGAANPSASLPPSLQAALRGKLDALSPSARLLVQSCAVLGPYASLARLELMLGFLPHAIASALGELEAWGLIERRDERVGCRHDLIADEVVRGLGPTLAAYLHRRCAAILDEEIRRAPVATMAWECARHWDQAGEHVRALELTGMIADQLLSLGLPTPAADLCERAIQYCRTADQHAERLLRLSRARRLLYDWKGVISALEHRKVLLAGGTPNPYSEDEISIFEARWWQHLDGGILRPAISRVIDRRAPTLHRLEMAVLALIVADNHHKRREAAQIADAIESLLPTSPREELEKYKARLIYHSAFGDVDVALTSGLRVVEIERRGGSSASLLRALRWLSLPMKLANDPKGAAALLTEAYERAARLGLRTEMWNAVYYLEALAVECEDLALATEWAPVCASLANETALNPTAASNSAFFLAQVEFMRGRLSEARALLDHSRKLQAVGPHGRAEQSLLALDVLLRSLAGTDPIPKVFVARLRRLHLQTRDSGVGDLEAAGLFSGLVHAGKANEAKTLCDDYLRLRRTRAPEHSALVRVRELLSR